MSNPTPIAALIKTFARIYNKQHLFDEAQAVNIWKTLMSPEILAHTLKAEMQNGILFIKVDSPALKNNLRFGVEELRQKINAHFSQEVVKTIAIL
jgi:predicted nucleic acid-binding Zn ribbon protein